MHLAAGRGHIEVIKFLLPLFGERVHEKDNHSYTMLHWAVRYGHCQVARYLIEEVHLDPQDRDKVCGMPEDCAGFKVKGLNVACVCVCVCVRVCVCVCACVCVC